MERKPDPLQFIGRFGGYLQVSFKVEKETYNRLKGKNCTLSDVIRTLAEVAEEFGEKVNQANLKELLDDYRE